MLAVVLHAAASKTRERTAVFCAKLHDTAIPRILEVIVAIFFVH